jgi:hypothetical protein
MTRYGSGRGSVCLSHLFPAVPAPAGPAVGVIGSLSVPRARDPSQICRSVTPLRPALTKQTPMPGRRSEAATAGQTRRGPGQRRPGDHVLVPPGPLPRRCRLRRARRRQPDPRQQRRIVQPRLRPPPEPHPARHPLDSLAHMLANPGPHCPAPRRRQDRSRNPPLPQALFIARLYRCLNTAMAA